MSVEASKMSFPSLVAGTELSTRKSITVTIPATSANLGPGFDCMGLALDIWNDLTVSRANCFGISIEGEGENALPRDETNLVVLGVHAAFGVAGYEPSKVPPLHYHCVNRIPFAMGLGSSSAAIVGGLVAGLALIGLELPVYKEEAMLNLACEIEGHPDNVAPAIYGAMQLGIFTSPELPSDEAGSQASAGGLDTQHGRTEQSGQPSTSVASKPPCQPINSYQGRWYTSRVRLFSGLQCILFLPSLSLSTSAARAILPATVPREHAIFNAGRCALLVNAFATGDLADLRHAMQDKLHQPIRGERHFPHLRPLIAAALEAGAHGACLSGAGPAVIAFTSGAKGDVYSQQKAERGEVVVAEAMKLAAKKINLSGTVFITQPSERGAHLVAADPPFSEASVHRFTHGTRGIRQPL
eukprot:GHVS01088206.1.p1 GENE.GHVS01088206.1~~GHVS01088206.1.p1  ORF type:complete len:412 (+),score=25.97 GHVS01088206.1:135-1370(+)